MLDLKEVLARKDELIALKKEGLKRATVASYEHQIATKAEDQGETVEGKYTIVGNTAYWMDSDGDVLLPTSWEKSIQSGASVKLLQDHDHTLAGIIGKVEGMRTGNYEWQGKQATGLLMDIMPMAELNQKAYDLYKLKMIDQHSIGFKYIDVELVERGTETWAKVYPMILNPEKADKYGYFWLVKEIDLKEVSAVLFGSNALTPVLEAKTETQPSKPSQQTINTFKPFFTW